MLRNNLLIAYRNLIKNTIFSSINILGMAIGMAAFLFVVQYVRFERSYEDFHKNSHNIFRVTTEFYNGAEYVMTDCETFAPLGPLLKDKMPEVVDFVRMYGNDGLVSVKTGSETFLESGVYWADPSAFDVFTYQTVNGDLTKALIAPFEVVLSESMANKYFGRTEVADESIEIDKNLYRIKAVIADLPANTHLKFSFLLSRLSLKTLKPWYPDDKWNNNNEFTYLLMAPGTSVDEFNKKLGALGNSELKEIVDRGQRFIAEPISDIHLYSNKMYEAEAGGNAETVYYFTIIALFIIGIAWINYVNLSTARAVERAREVGIRKVMGSQKAQLVLQFLAESLIVNLIAGLLALVLFQLVFPFFRDLSGQPLQLNLMADKLWWYLVLGLVGIGSLLSGIYPAFVLASFRPAAVLKGKFQSSGHGQFLRKGLVVLQFSATVVLIISLCTVYMQINFMRNQDLGMNIDQTLVLTGQQINAPDSVFRQTSQALKTELLKNPMIVSASRSQSLPGVDMQELSTTSIWRMGSSPENKGYIYYYFGADAGYVPTMKMSFIAGRNFEDGMENRDQIIINDEARKLLGFSTAEQAVGAKIEGGSTIIGVLNNFHFRSPKEGHLPMFIYFSEPADYFAIRISTNDGGLQDIISSVEAAWSKAYPNTVFDYFFLNEKYNQQYRADAQFGGVITAFSVLVIFIACLGLFGLSSYTLSQRTKEIGIRKVLGASVIQIVRLISADFAKTVIIAALIALPIAYFAMESWLSNYYLRISLNAWVFIFAIALILLLAAITVSFQTIKTAVANPVDSLKQE